MLETNIRHDCLSVEFFAYDLVTNVNIQQNLKAVGVFLHAEQRYGAVDAEAKVDGF